MSTFTEDPDVFMREGRTNSGINGDGSTARPRFTLIPFDNLKPGKARRYLVKGWIPRVGLTLVWGPPKCGKSFWTFDLMMHVALGWTYRGHRVVGGPVVYIALEGGDGMNARAAAFRRQHGLPDMSNAGFHLVRDTMVLVNDHTALLAAVRAAFGDGKAPVAVVIDTVNRSFSGSESSDEDMTGYIRAADAIWQAFQCAVVLVHHCGHDGNRPRGHSALLGAVDAQIAVTRDAADNIIATVERMKDGAEGATVASRLEQVEVGTDEDGDPITSCIVVSVEGEVAKPAVKGPTLPKSAKIALRALNVAIDEAGQIPPASNHIPASTRAVTVDLWRQYAYQRGISASDTGERARQMAFKRASEHLVAVNRVSVWGEHVWPTR